MTPTGKANRGYWTCRICRNTFPRPTNFHQRICNDCLSLEIKCTCSDDCQKIIKKYKPTGKECFYNMGHSPQEREARSNNGRKVWDVPGFREKVAETNRKTNKKMMKDKEYVESLRQRMKKMSLKFWEDPEYRRMHETMDRSESAQRAWARSSQRS